MNTTSLHAIPEATARGLRLAAALALCAAGLWACGRSDPPPDPGLREPASGAQAASASATAASAAAASPAATAASGPPVAVTTTRVRRQDLPITVTAVGTVTAVKSVDLKPQVSSVVEKVLVKEGQFVKSGELLFTLDARADQANVAKLRAQQARDEASLADALRQLQRNKELLATNFVSQAAVDSAQSVVDAQRAAVAADRAALDAAQVALGYSRIVAPLSGRVGAIPVVAGSAVVANQTTLITITQVDPIDVAFSLPQRELPGALSALASGHAPVRLTLPDGQGTLQGQLVFVDNAIDLASGSVKVKARFDNRPPVLWPGAYAQTAMTVRTLKDAVVVPQGAIVQGQRGSVAFAVVDGHAVSRTVEIVATQGELAAVRGLQPGESVVLDGRQNLRPGSAVIERGAAQ